MTLLLDLSIHNGFKTFLISHSNFTLPIKQETQLSRETEREKNQMQLRKGFGPIVPLATIYHDGECRRDMLAPVLFNNVS